MKQEWRQFFKMVYHPNPGWFILHWTSNSKPVNEMCFRVQENAEKWIEENWQLLIAEQFEKAVFDDNF